MTPLQKLVKWTSYAVVLATIALVSARFPTPIQAAGTITVTQADAATWLPQGDLDGDEIKRGNELVLTVRWGGMTGNPRSISVTASPTMLRGLCTNKGEHYYPDFAIESCRNVGTVPPISSNDWSVIATQDIPDYLSHTDHQCYQTLFAESQLLGQDQDVELRIRSYDWLGRVTLSFTAPGCVGTTVTFPRDTNGDTIPDRLEELYGTTALGPSWDRDTDDRDPPLHHWMKRGDGFTWREELRGFFTYNPTSTPTVQRLDALPCYSNGTRIGGWRKKDAFVYPDTSQVQGVGDLFQPNNFLEDFSIAWHRVYDSERWGGNSVDTSGYAQNDTEDYLQTVIWIKEDNSIDDLGQCPGTPIIPGETDPVRMQANSPIKINVDTIKLFADQYGAQLDLAIKSVVAHELGHMFMLEHPKIMKTCVLYTPSLSPSLGVFYQNQTDPETIHFWTPYRPMNEKNLPLEWPPNDEERENCVILSEPEPDAVASGSTATIHDEEHPLFFWTVKVNKVYAYAEDIYLCAHTGRLMDLLPHYEFSNLTWLQLDEDEKTQPKLRSN